MQPYVFCLKFSFWGVFAEPILQKQWRTDRKAFDERVDHTVRMSLGL